MSSPQERYRQRLRKENPEKLTEMNRRYRENYKRLHPDRFKEIMRKSQHLWHQNLKFSVMAVYCEGNPFCLCCGETRIEFLTIDHIHNDGATHRKTLGHKGEGHNFYKWLKNNDFPEGFQVLCFNCNLSKSQYGYCPHHFSDSFIRDGTDI